MRGIHRIVGVVFVAFALCALAACGSSSSSSSGSTTGSAPAAGTTAASSTGSPFTLLWIGDRSGATKLYGLGELHGLESAVDYINANGGMAGHHIDLILDDDGGMATTAVTDLIKYLSSHPAPNAVWAGTESDETGALLPVLQQHHILGYAQTDGPDLLQNGSAQKLSDEFDPGSPKQVADVAAAAWFKSKNFHKARTLGGVTRLHELRNPADPGGTRQAAHPRQPLRRPSPRPRPT